MGGAMVLGTLSVLGRPTDLDNSMARACCACSGCVLTFLFSSVNSLFFLPVSWCEGAGW